MIAEGYAARDAGVLGQVTKEARNTAAQEMLAQFARLAARSDELLGVVAVKLSPYRHEQPVEATTSKDVAETWMPPCFSDLREQAHRIDTNLREIMRVLDETEL